jgi:hypothetical protein
MGWEVRSLLLWKFPASRGQLKRDDTRAETRFRLSAKRTSPFKSAGASVQSTTGSRGVRISGSNAGYSMLRGSVKGSGYPFHSPVSPSLPLPCVTVCHHISTGVYPLVLIVNVAWHQGKKFVTGSELLGVCSRAKKLRICVEFYTRTATI